MKSAIWYGDDIIEFLSFGFQNLGIGENTNFQLQIVSYNMKKKIINIPTNGNKTDCKALNLFYNVMSEIIPLMKSEHKSNEEIIVEKIKNCIRTLPDCSMSDIAMKCKISEPYLICTPKVRHFWRCIFL